MKIFVIGALGRHEQFINKILNDLKPEGFEFYIPPKNINENEFKQKEASKLIDCDATILFLSQESSIVDANNVCLDEAQAAIDNNKLIIPIKLEQFMPFAAYPSLNYIDFSEFVSCDVSNNQAYLDKLKRIVYAFKNT